MLEKLFSDPSLQKFKEEVLAASSLLIENLWDTPKALLTVLLWKATGKNILIISGKKEDRFLDALSFFGKEALDFLPWETLPGEEIPPSLDISGQRLDILYKLAKKKKGHIVHCPVQSLMQKTVSKKKLIPLCLSLKKGEETSFEALPELLTNLGYIRTPVASDKGEFAIRGGLVDIFPISAKTPYRIDFFGDTVEGIRAYDPVGQTSIKKVSEIFLSPASEYTLLKEEKKPATLFDYLGKETLIILDDLLEIEDAYVSLLSSAKGKSSLLFPLEEILDEMQKLSHLFFLQQTAESLSDVSLDTRVGREFYSGKKPFQPLSFQFFLKSFSTNRWHHPFLEVSSFFSRFENKATASLEEIFLGIDDKKASLPDLRFIVNSEAEEKMIRDKSEGLLPENTSFEPGYLPSGFVMQGGTFVCIPTSELTQRHKVRRKEWRSTYHTPSSEFHQLSPGDTVVHLHSGIGKFLGVTSQKNNLGETAEYLEIEYAKESKLFIPVSQSHLISRYIGSKEEKPSFSVLGSNKWHKTCVAAHTSILGYAKQLLEQMASRVSSAGFSFPTDSLDMQLFEEAFPFSETEDQLKAIDAVKLDMKAPKAMDRLICGDVGYGKTEVALRAAFKAVCDGKKQVAILVPTTILALQHYETFKERMEDFAVTVAVISRFSTPKEAREILKKVKAGQVDILIGTHRLLSKDIAFKDLGLLIIDEEQKFGVRAKEHIKSLKIGVDCITLSATPIPRTLYMSLIGAREISEISTPPRDRLPIKSIIAEKDASLIKNAILREFARNGQVFFIHNRVETLPLIYDELKKLLPEARITMGHGQMDSKEIDTVFHSFKTGESDLLLSTTIVESGIDIPNANTIFIDRADMFGMADLYQLRGRVGRWNRPAYAYFLTQKNRILPEPAKKRLGALIESSGFGGGLKLALRDLEIRGAGDILGEQQSGQVSAIGFHLYCRLLKKAVGALKKQQPIELMETKMEFGFGAKLPSNYINESSLRMEIYYRLGNVSEPIEIDMILKEVEDRFGKAPEAVELLILFSKIKLAASAMQITSLKFEKFTFIAEKQKGGKTIRKTFALPSIKKPLEFEIQVLESLKQWSP